MAEEEVFKVNTGDEDSTVSVEQEFEEPEADARVGEAEGDGVVLDTSTGKGMENMEIPDSMRAPAFEGGRSVRIYMNEKYGFPHGIQITAGIANHKPQLVGKPSDVEKHSIPEDDIIIEVGADIVWRASVDGFPDTQRGPEWVTEILNKVVGTEDEVEDVEVEIIN